MKDYRRLVSRKPPEGLLASVADELETAGLVYKQEWVLDSSVGSMLTEPGRKVKMVRCTCSGCGDSFLMDYAHPEANYYGGKSCYGFWSSVCQGVERIGNGDNMLCPMCGAPVLARCAARVGRGEFASDETTVMSASLLPGEAGNKPLVLTAWRIRRLVDRDAGERFETQPLEAYIFEGKGAYKLSGWSKSYHPSLGTFMAVNRDWRQPVDWSETWGQCKKIFGLTRELVEDSCLHNSKFDLYMEQDWRENWKSPVPYLRLCQLYPQIENLVVQGCTHILDSLFSEKMRRDRWEGNSRGVISLPELDLEEKRPAQMLWLTKEEFACMRAQCWDAYHWGIFVKAKKAGDRLRLPEDIETIHQYGAEDLDCLVGKAPIGKCVRYLLKQMEYIGMMNDPYNEYSDVYVDDDLIEAKTLSDYWDMAVVAGWDLNNPAVRWPRDLIAAHDRAMAASKAVKAAGLKPHFRKRKKELERYAYASGSLMIRPAASQSQLNEEGDVLSHCVHQYGEDHALGKTAIFFIRHTWAPRTPYFTLEFDEEAVKVKQNRGKCNCSRTEEVAAFEKEWLAWVRKGCPRKKDGTPRGAKPVQKKKMPETDAG